MELNTQTQSHTEESVEYPALLARYLSLFIDGACVLTVMILVMTALDGSDYRSPVMIALWLIFGFGYEPILTAYSRTLGQRLMGIAVRRHDNTAERIRLWEAYLRWITKAALGWISFVTIHSNPHKRAVHDFAGRSVMIKYREKQ